MRPILLAAALIGAMPVLAAADAVARSRTCPTASTGITLPDRALLAAPPEFDCDFKDAGRGDAGGAGPVPAGAQADAALRRKLDYERQCYRHAEMILRSRLLDLQAPAGETIEAAAKCNAAKVGTSARRASRTTLPLPDRALLATPPEFACEFKDAGRDDASGGPQPSPPRAQTDVSADLALRRKLEYERQCYRHAEMILRDRLLQLQASLGETITAVSRSSDVAAERSSGWGQYRDKELGLAFDLPAHIFPLDSAERGPAGTLFSSPDGRAQLRVFGFVNEANDTPRQYLRRTAKTDEANFTYVHTASTFFVASGTRDGMIFYRRCHFSSSAEKRIGCIQLDYPQQEKRAWDAAVTRTSRSLRMVALD
jgi:hypothetical protein